MPFVNGNSEKIYFPPDTIKSEMIACEINALIAVTVVLNPIRLLLRISGSGTCSRVGSGSKL